MAEAALTGAAERGRGKVDVVGLLGGRPVGAAAEAALRGAALVAGGRDQLAAVADLLAPGARQVEVGAGLAALDEVARSVEPTCVLASGDPGCFGILRPLAARVGGERVVVHPAPSSVALAFARLGLPWETAVVRSCHTGGAVRVAAEVGRLPRAAVLCGPAAPPEALGAALLAVGAAHPVVAVATRLGEPGEEVQRCADLAALAAGRFDPRSVVVLAWPEPASAAIGRPGGRPVADFAHRASMITKPEVRSVVLGKLDLPERGVLWDVGAGSGSVAIEAALAAPGLRVIAVERDAGDASRVLVNAAALGAVIEVVEGAAPAALADLPAPDRVFVGGGGLEVLDAAFAALRPGGRLVATFAAVDRAAAAHRRLGSLVQVGVHRAEVLPDGGVRFAADNPVFVAWGDRPMPPSPTRGGRVAVGVGCSSTATPEEVAAAVTGALAAAGIDASSGAHPDPALFATDDLDGSAPTDGLRERGQPLGAAAGSDTAAASRQAVVIAGTDLSFGAHPDPAVISADEQDGSRLTDEVTERGQPPGAAVAAASRHDVVVATIDARRDHPAVVAAAGERLLVSFPPALMGLVDVPDPSDVVHAAVGTPSVAEAAALLAAGPGARLVVGKQRGATTTAAVAVGGARPRAGGVHVVGLGPGHPCHRTPAATTAVRQADAVVGYGPYVDAAGTMLRPDQMVVRSTMGDEAGRALSALALARAGWRVALVSSGDPGVFAMASVTLELAVASGADDPVDVVIVPGVTASAVAAAAVGAPLSGPHAVLTLSDLLLPWSVIEAQLRAAAGSGMALALYNPRSAGRPDHLERARTVLLEALDPATPVAVVTAAGGTDEQVHRTSLGGLDPTVAGMRSLVLVGTADTVDAGGRLLTRRHHPRPEVSR